jgi:hypothetical protein
VSGIKDKDFLLELCKNCKNSQRGGSQSVNSKNVKIISYSNLKKGDNNDPQIPHRSDLCLKCLKGYPCKRYFSSYARFVSEPLSGSYSLGETILSSNFNRNKRCFSSLDNQRKEYKLENLDSSKLIEKSEKDISITSASYKKKIFDI